MVASFLPLQAAPFLFIALMSAWPVCALRPALDVVHNDVRADEYGEQSLVEKKASSGDPDLVSFAQFIQSSDFVDGTLMNSEEIEDYNIQVVQHRLSVERYNQAVQERERVMEQLKHERHLAAIRQEKFDKEDPPPIDPVPPLGPRPAPVRLQLNRRARLWVWKAMTDAYEERRKLFSVGDRILCLYTAILNFKAKMNGIEEEMRTFLASDRSEDKARALLVSILKAFYAPLPASGDTVGDDTQDWNEAGYRNNGVMYSLWVLREYYSKFTDMLSPRSDGKGVTHLDFWSDVIPKSSTMVPWWEIDNMEGVIPRFRGTPCGLNTREAMDEVMLTPRKVMTLVHELAEALEGQDSYSRYLNDMLASWGPFKGSELRDGLFTGLRGAPLWYSPDPADWPGDSATAISLSGFHITGSGTNIGGFLKKYVVAALSPSFGDFNKRKLNNWAEWDKKAYRGKNYYHPNDYLYFPRV